MGSESTIPQLYRTHFLVKKDTNSNNRAFLNSTSRNQTIKYNYIPLQTFFVQKCYAISKTL